MLGCADKITVQMFPFLDTTNNGGEYKAWLTPTCRYESNSADVPSGDAPTQSNTGFGFVNKYTKTDNFKVCCKHAMFFALRSLTL